MGPSRTIAYSFSQARFTFGEEPQNVLIKKTLTTNRVPTTFVVEDQLSVANGSVVEVRAQNARIVV
jgi:hypothetical protein